MSVNVYCQLRPPVDGEELIRRSVFSDATADNVVHVVPSDGSCGVKNQSE
eukprot:gene6010-5886_t